MQVPPDAINPTGTTEITQATSAAACEMGLIYTKLRIGPSTLEFDTKA